MSRLSTFILTVFITSFFSSHVLAADYQLINQLPSMRASAYKKAQKDWDSGITGKMIAGSSAYGEALLQMCDRLASKHYPKNHFGPNGIRPILQKLASDEASLAFLINDTSGDGGGTINSVRSSSTKTDVYEKTIRDMVASITMGDDKFDFEKWKRQWKTAGE